MSIFFKSHGKVYAINWIENFRENIPDSSVKITKNTTTVKISNYHLSVKPEWIWGIIRYAAPWDSYKGKRVNMKIQMQKILDNLCRGFKKSGKKNLKTEMIFTSKSVIITDIMSMEIGKELKTSLEEWI